MNPSPNTSISPTVTQLGGSSRVMRSRTKRPSTGRGVPSASVSIQVESAEVSTVGPGFSAHCATMTQSSGVASCATSRR